MNIGIVGSGFVGLTIGAVFAHKGLNVKFVDVDENKVEMIKKGRPFFYEENLEEFLKEGVEKGLIDASTNYDILKDSDIIFITVGTPSREDGSIDLKYIQSAAKNISNILKTTDKYKLVVMKSTVVPTTTESVVLPILRESGKDLGEFGLAMNPEFLREGSAVKDFLNQDRIVIGTNDEKSSEILEKFYKEYFPDSPIVKTDLKTAEMIKYTANSFLAMKISFINEIGNLCKKLGIDVYKVVEGIKYDERIGGKFLNAGIGFGGSCFPKDVRAIINFSLSQGYEPKILKSVIDVNEKQPLKAVEILEKRIGEMSGKTVGVLGISFKPNTDDTRESRSFIIIKELNKKGANVLVYDPMAKLPEEYNAKQVETLEEIVKTSDAIIIATEWGEFKQLENMVDSLKGKIIIEGRRLLDKEKMKGVHVEGVCW